MADDGAVSKSTFECLKVSAIRSNRGVDGQEYALNLPFSAVEHRVDGQPVGSFCSNTTQTAPNLRSEAFEAYWLLTLPVYKDHQR